MASINGIKLIHEAGWDFPLELWAKLNEYERNFAIAEFSGLRTLDYYKKRLINLGFLNCGFVLDAACGMGQWALGLASIGNNVIGIDLMESRIEVSRTMSHAHRTNCQFQTGSIEELPFPDQSFDGLFCYGAFMFTSMPKTLAEFSRVLKPGGRLYINGNSWGWYAHLIIDRGIKAGNYALVRTALKMMMRTLVGRSSQIVISERWVRNQLRNAGFNVLALGAEGKVSVNISIEQPLPSAYPDTFYGMRSIIELVAERAA